MQLEKDVRIRESCSKHSPSHRCRALKPCPKDAVKSPLKHLHSYLQPTLRSRSDCPGSPCVCVCVRVMLYEYIN